MNPERKRIAWWRWSLLVVVLLIYPGSSALFTVDAAELVYLTQFGRKVAIYDGGAADQAGLHFKWPWPVQSVQRLDRRLQTFELADAELVTRDAKVGVIDTTITVDAYVCWRIDGADGADRFVRTVGGPEGARLILGTRIANDLATAITEMEMQDLVSTDAKRIDDRRDLVRQRLLDEGEPPLRQTAREVYGIEVVDVRIRRVSHPARVRESIFDRIRSERAKKVADYESKGTLEAAKIRTKAEREVADMKTNAEREAKKIRGEAKAHAEKILSDAALQGPEFYLFLRKLEDYQRILGDGKTTLLLSTHREMFDLLYAPPGAAKEKKD